MTAELRPSRDCSTASCERGGGSGGYFLFFGWLRRVEQVDSRWRYVKSAPDIHSLFGWLQVGEVIPVSRKPDVLCGRYPWVPNHSLPPRAKSEK